MYLVMGCVLLKAAPPALTGGLGAGPILWKSLSDILAAAADRDILVSLVFLLSIGYTIVLFFSLLQTKCFAIVLLIGIFLLSKTRTCYSDSFQSSSNRQKIEVIDVIVL